MLSWGNVNLFDFRGRLITGKVRLDLWPAPISLDSMSLLNPLGITGLKKLYLLKIDFQLRKSCFFRIKYGQRRHNIGIRIR